MNFIQCFGSLFYLFYGSVVVISTYIYYICHITYIKINLKYHKYVIIRDMNDLEESLKRSG